MANLSIVFLWVCWQVAAATQTLTNWIVDPSEGKRKIELEDGVTNVKEGFPIMGEKKAMRGIFKRYEAADGVGAGATPLAHEIKWHIAGGLKVRIAIILGFLWLLNMVSTQATEYEW